jgi:4-hydroxyphenylpyruvate dioxygenase
MTAPDGIVRIPLNESSDPKSQINEYLDEYKGEGIQHIACFTDDIYDTVEAMRAQAWTSSTRPTPTIELIDERIPGHGEDLERMREELDPDRCRPGDQAAQAAADLHQTRSARSSSRSSSARATRASARATSTALFEAIERDQIKRGVL